MSGSGQVDATRKIPWAPAGIAGAWTFLVVDFLLHAVLLAPWWQSTGSFWLPPGELFRRIPFGYASFLICAGTLVGLLVRLHGECPPMRRALRFGAVAGLIGGTSWTLATYSVFPMPGSALIVWPICFLLESTLTSAAAAWVLSAARPRRRAGLVVVMGVLLFLVGVVAQNLLFPVPATQLTG